MASSLINTECKRYGCIKNLLACYANCRYNSRCDELRDEIESKSEQAAKDINQYLAERGGSPIAIQFLKRGLKFVKAAPDAGEKKKTSQPKAQFNLPASTAKMQRKKRNEIGIMEKKSKRIATKAQVVPESTTPAQPAGEVRSEKASGKKRSKSHRPTPSSSNGRAGRKGSKTYIILEGKSASVVDERGLMQHILSGSSNEARYFEATEVEARLQIVAMR